VPPRSVNPGACRTAWASSPAIPAPSGSGSATVSIRATSMISLSSRVPTSFTSAAAISGASPSASAPATASDIWRHAQSRETTRPSAPAAPAPAAPALAGRDASSPASVSSSTKVDKSRSGPLRS
jgi:hypothetical protein